MNNIEYLQYLCNKMRTINSECIYEYQNGYVGKKINKYTLADGSIKISDQITKNGRNGDAVVIIPITNEGKFVIIVESRPNVDGGVAIEFPAGMVDDNESFENAALRELKEETGYVADKIEELEWHYQDQGCSKAIIKVFLATGCKKEYEQNLDESEKINYVELNYEDMINLLFNKEYGFEDANSKIACMSYVLKRRR